MQSRHNASVDGTRLDHGILVPLHTQRKCDPYTGSDEEDFGSQIAKISDKESESTREFSPKSLTLKPSCNKVSRSMTNAYHSGTDSSTQNTSTSAASAKSIPCTSTHVYVFNNIPHSQF